MIAAIVLFFWINLLWCMNGLVQGMLWSAQTDKSFPWNEHIVFVIQAALAVLAPFIGAFSCWLYMIAVAISCTFTYSFFYNGIYYLSRSRISKNNNIGDPYPNGFTSNPSNKSTADLNLSWKFRKITFIIGVVFAIVSFTLIKVL